jgi:imidazolonepropionase-like amidohydrolase
MKNNDTERYVLFNVRLVRGGVCEEDISYVIVNGNRIEALGSMKEYAGRGVADAELEERDLTGCYVMPGLIDAHIHLAGARGDAVYGETGTLAEPLPVRAMRSVYEAQKLLKRGVTSVRDISYNGLSLKRIFGEGLMPGPRVIACGPGLTRTGGHADAPQYPLEFVARQHPWGVIADGEDEIRRAVRRNLREGADQIKIFASGGGNWAADRMTDTHYTQRELDACCEEAHIIEGTLVCAHAETAETIRMCIAAGVDTIEHGEEVDDEMAETMRERGIILVPTINLIANWYRDFMSPDGPLPDRPDAFLYRDRDDPFGMGEIEADRECVIASFETARRHGVKIALGSDTVYEPLTEYGEYTLLEYLALVDFGMSVPEAIRAATEAGAEALGMAHRIGKLEEGYLADLLVLDADPTTDAGVLYNADNIRCVIANGRLSLDRGRLMF